MIIQHTKSLMGYYNYSPTIVPVNKNKLLALPIQYSIVVHTMMFHCHNAEIHLRNDYQIIVVTGLGMHLCVELASIYLCMHTL